MSFPLETFTQQPEIGLLGAVLVGFAFGFVLERAGFGRAQKLVAQFYLDDMTVLKVMFGAIVTAMLGSGLLHGLGLLDLRALADFATSGTYLGPMIAGGLLLGVGFIVAGYCPGTSVVAAASGKLDGVVTVLGVVAGSVLYAEAQTWTQSFHDSGAFGHVYLYDLLGVAPQVVALLIVAMATGAFLGAERVEALFRAGRPEAEAARARRRWVLAGYGAAALLVVATLALSTRPPAAGARVAQRIEVAELVRHVLEEPWTLRILDLRDREACAERRVPGSECVPAAELASLALADQAGTRDLVLIAAAELDEVPAEAAGYPGRIRILAGGFAAWAEYALTVPRPPAAGAPAAALDEHRLRTGLAAAMTGVQQAPPAPAAPAVRTAPRKKKEGGGCGG